jgi:hypothetical protein
LDASGSLMIDHYFRHLPPRQTIIISHRQRSHRIWHNPDKGKVIVIPDGGSKDPTAGIVRTIIRELGISHDIFGPIK